MPAHACILINIISRNYMINLLINSTAKQVNIVDKRSLTFSLNTAA